MLRPVALLLLAAIVLPASAEPPAAPPTLTLVRRGKGLGELEVTRWVATNETRTATNKVPETRTAIVDGKEVTSIVYRDVTYSYIEVVTRPVNQTFDVADLDLQTLEGKSIPVNEREAIFKDEPRPVILLESVRVVEEGKERVSVPKIDPAYLKALKPDTLIVIVPAQTKPAIDGSLLPGPTIPVPKVRRFGSPLPPGPPK